jgi:hypothetical protein
MTDHSSHNHPATPAARARCRKLSTLAADRAAYQAAHGIAPLPSVMEARVELANAPVMIEVKLADADWQPAEWIGEGSTDGVPNGRLVVRLPNGFITTVHPAATRPLI